MPLGPLGVDPCAIPSSILFDPPAYPCTPRLGVLRSDPRVSSRVAGPYLAILHLPCYLSSAEDRGPSTVSMSRRRVVSAVRNCHCQHTNTRAADSSPPSPSHLHSVDWKAGPAPDLGGRPKRTSTYEQSRGGQPSESERAPFHIHPLRSISRSIAALAGTHAAHSSRSPAHDACLDWDVVDIHPKQGGTGRRGPSAMFFLLLFGAVPISQSVHVNVSIRRDRLDECCCLSHAPAVGMNGA